MKRAIAGSARTRLFRYLLAIAIACLLALIAWAVLQAMLGTDDVIVIEVAPIGEPGRFQVQVEGAIVHPGVYDLPEGATVNDAVVMAGGLAEGGQLGNEHADALVTDGELIVIPGSDATDTGPAGPVNINTATVEELDVLPGVGPVIADRIVAYRETNGGFGSIDDLAEVSGISERMVVEMSDLIVVESE